MSAGQRLAVARPTLPGWPDLGRTRVMGILNVTPDSFSDGGRFLDSGAAIAHGLRLVADGADLVDVGGESTRPGADRVDAATERARVLPVVASLAAQAVPVSVDTTRAEVAAAALEAGAVLVNDVSGGLADPAMTGVVARAGVGYVVMHSRGPSADMAATARYDDVVAEVVAELSARRAAAVAAGVDPGAVLLDPGIGFHKTAAHNWALLAALPRLVALGAPLLLGTSRKTFLGALLGDGQHRRALDAREAGTVATTALAAAAGVWAVRVHDVAGNADAVRVAAAWAAGGGAVPRAASGGAATP